MPPATHWSQRDCQVVKMKTENLEEEESYLKLGRKSSRRDVFSICGKLLGYHPVRGSLRIACSYLKCQADGENWKEKLEVKVKSTLKEILKRVRKEDPVRGTWEVPTGEKGSIWCDASNLAMGVLLDIEGNIVEVAALIRKKKDLAHINIAELEAVLRGINLALKWNLKDLEITIDSVTVVNWLKSIISKREQVNY